MSSKRSLLMVPVATLLALLLAGCGDGGGDATGMAANNTGTGTGTSNVDDQPATAGTFLQRVMAIIGQTSETAQPVDISDSAAEPETDGSPLPVS